MPLPLPGKCERETKTENANKDARRMEDAGTAEGREFDENDPLRSKHMRHYNAVVLYNLE